MVPQVPIIPTPICIRIEPISERGASYSQEVSLRIAFSIITLNNIMLISSIIQPQMISLMDNKNMLDSTIIISFQYFSALNMDPQSITFQLLKNDSKASSMEALILLKSVIVDQLPKLQPVHIIQNLMNRHSQSLICWNQAQRQVICGVSFRVFQQVGMVDILYFVTKDNFQGKGLGYQLINKLKVYMQKREIKQMVTYADYSSLQFYHKVGFIQMNQQTACKQKWKPYIYEFDGSHLMVCEVHNKMDYENLKTIVQTQYQQALDLIENVKHQGFSFSKQEAEGIVKDEIIKYFKSKGKSYIEKQQKQFIKSTLLNPLKTESSGIKLQSCEQYRSKLFNEQKQLSQLYQIAIIEKMRSLQYSWILNIPFRYQNKPSKLLSTEAVTLQQMEHNVYDGQYFTSSELCAQIYEALKLLNQYFSNDSSYIKNLRHLEDSLIPFLQGIQQGTFDIYEHYSKELK